jgi:hypothetical protein
MRLLAALGLTQVPDQTNIKGHGRRRVCVPEVIWRSPVQVRAAFIAGLFEADGTAGETGLSLGTKYHRLALDVQLLLNGFGIESRVVERWGSAKKGGESFQSFSVTLNRHASDVFAGSIGFLSKRKRDKLDEIVSRTHSNAYREMAWSETVVSVEECEVDPIDLQVVGEVFAAGGFTSHNTAIKVMEGSAAGVPMLASAFGPYLEWGAVCTVAEKRYWDVCLENMLDWSVRQEWEEEQWQRVVQEDLGLRWVDWYDAYARLS